MHIMLRGAPYKYYIKKIYKRDLATKILEKVIS